jgi:hypothetical protein
MNVYQLYEIKERETEREGEGETEKEREREGERGFSHARLL